MTEPEPGSPTIATVLEELGRLQRAFEAKIRYDSGRERVIETMSAELEKHRAGFQQALLRPVLLDLVSLHDDLTQAIDARAIDAQAIGGGAPAEATGGLAYVRDTVEQILARNDVHRFAVEGDSVDRNRQQVVSTVATPDPSLGRQVARRLRAGFTWSEKVLRPEWVTAYRHVAAESSDPVEEVEEVEEGAPR
ncbi:nucleotide exchange factor GrpE [Nonomuraea sp. NPDC050394]|uniref:nucleotide exchange factor GrpE n=1 Tax=Nonomuraea sp. NPDC050394 TaxID=3364363 RepID=UPI0037AF8019